ncbi:MAG: creatinine amidohydrolase/Fe(II)-dependent formamide hydrolase-like protein [Limisphaerales bacterium]
MAGILEIWGDRKEVKIYFSAMNLLDANYLPQQINSGWLLTGYSLNELELLARPQRLILPICSLGTSVRELAELGGLVLPPLYHEALDDGLKRPMLERIRECFPFYLGTGRRGENSIQLEVVELPAVSPEPVQCEIACFSVDTAVEEHGPHLPLMTDTLQSYGVLQALADADNSLTLAPPVEYGQLTWGLPFGFSIDLTPPLVTRYVTGFMDAILNWCSPQAVYVVDVHGSIVHRNAIQAGMAASRCKVSAFRWLHDPLVEFAGDRGDQHAGAVETALIEYLNPALLNSEWWQFRRDELIEQQMDLDTAIRLSSDMPSFIAHVEEQGSNGIVGAIENYPSLDAEEMFGRMVAVAREDIIQLKRRLAAGVLA